MEAIFELKVRTRNFQLLKMPCGVCKFGMSTFITGDGGSTVVKVAGSIPDGVGIF